MEQRGRRWRTGQVCVCVGVGGREGGRGDHDLVALAKAVADVGKFEAQVARLVGDKRLGVLKRVTEFAPERFRPHKLLVATHLEARQRQEGLLSIS